MQGKMGWKEWVAQGEAEAQAQREAKAAKADARLRRRSGPMLLRTCRHCGHEWVVPKRLKSAAQQGSMGAALTRQWAAGALLAHGGKDLDTCPACGSVRYFREERVKE
jgi:hypothetical protein